MDEHPGIHFRDGASGRRPAVIGGPDVWEIVMVVKDNDGSAEEAAAYLEVDPRIVHAALGYYGENAEEVDAWIARVHEIADREEAKWRTAHEAISR